MSQITKPTRDKQLRLRFPGTVLSNEKHYTNERKRSHTQVSVPSNKQSTFNNPEVECGQQEGASSWKRQLSGGCLSHSTKMLCNDGAGEGESSALKARRVWVLCRRLYQISCETGVVPAMILHASIKWRDSRSQCLTAQWWDAVLTMKGEGGSKR